MLQSVELAKQFGLECYSHRTDEQLQQDLDCDNHYFDVIFELNERYITIEVHTIDDRTVEGIWEHVSNIIIGKLLNYITMEGFRDQAY